MFYSIMKIGGEMKNDFDGWTVKLEVHNHRDTIKSSNVIGYITGSVEPDRLVLLKKLGANKRIIITHAL